jgi:hypothetical protein
MAVLKRDFLMDSGFSTVSQPAAARDNLCRGVKSNMANFCDPTTKLPYTTLYLNRGEAANVTTGVSGFQSE